MKALVIIICFITSSVYADVQLDPTGRCSGDAIFTESFCNKAVIYCPNDYGLRQLKLYPKGFSTSAVVDLEAASKDDIISNIVDSKPEVLNNCDVDELKFWDFDTGA